MCFPARSRRCHRCCRLPCWVKQFAQVRACEAVCLVPTLHRACCDSVLTELENTSIQSFVQTCKHSTRRNTAPESRPHVHSCPSSRVVARTRVASVFPHGFSARFLHGTHCGGFLAVFPLMYVVTTFSARDTVWRAGLRGGTYTADVFLLVFVPVCPHAALLVLLSASPSVKPVNLMIDCLP